MSRLTILQYPDPRLRTRARPVETFDAALAKFIDDLFETMYAAPGIGLAATWARMSSARAMASSRVQPGMTMTNSSPP